MVSLFTNIPLYEPMDIVCNYVCQQHSPSRCSKETSEKLFQITTGGSIFFIEVNYAVKLMV